MIRHRLLAGALLLVWAASPSAQEQAAPAAPAPSPTASPAVSLEQAYRREFALLSAQRRELQGRIAEARDQLARESERLRGEIAALERRVLAARREQGELEEAIAAAEREAAAAAEIADLLKVTFLQAEATLSGYGLSPPAAEDEGERLRATFAEAVALLERLASRRVERGRFFRADGAEVEGEIVRLGQIAAFGVTPEVAGVLAPAGAGRLKLWPEPAAEAARALARGQIASPLPVFLFESLNAAVEPGRRLGIIEHIQQGGVIGWVIVLLGLAGAVMILLRIAFLHRSSADVDRILDRVGPQVRAGRIQEAIEAAKQIKGSAARVVTATLRNLDREREHLEDIISEAILNENGRLNRFGTVILVIAGVAPLLGLLGTVTGMIQTFDIITEFGTSDPKLLSGGIAVALVTTELGLIVAIPTLLIGSLLSGWAERIKDEMEKVSLRVVNLGLEARGRVTA